MSLTTTTTIIDDRFHLGREIIQNEPSEQEERQEAVRQVRNLNNSKARVYRAEDAETGKIVALKVLNRSLSRLPEYRSRFQREAAIMQAFDHPHVVKTIGSGFTPEGQPYIAMELLEGRTLARRLEENGPIPPEEMGRYLSQVASALDAAHARGIVHRDINPGSMMILGESSPTPTIKLLDFGLAKEVDKPTDAQAELTGKQTILGNASYLSPEQARGGKVDARSDVYSLGVTLYQALTGQLPFQGETDFQILLAQINGNVPPFPRRWSDHPCAAGVEAVVLKALSKNPADRPPSVGILANLFSQALRGRLRRKHRVSWAWVAAGAGAAVALLVLGKWLI